MMKRMKLLKDAWVFVLKWSLINTTVFTFGITGGYFVGFFIFVYVSGECAFLLESGQEIGVECLSRIPIHVWIATSGIVGAIAGVMIGFLLGICQATILLKEHITRPLKWTLATMLCWTIAGAISLAVVSEIGIGHPFSMMPNLMVISPIIGGFIGLTTGLAQLMFIERRIIIGVFWWTTAHMLIWTIAFIPTSLLPDLAILSLIIAWTVTGSLWAWVLFYSQKRHIGIPNSQG